LGRVRGLLPALAAMLVDIGDARPAFLPTREIFPRRRRFDEGERVIVQIRREAQGGKAPRLTTGVALRGPLVELKLGRPGIRGGESLSPEDRAQLLAVVEDLDRIAPHPEPYLASGEREGPAKREGERSFGFRLRGL